MNKLLLVYHPHEIVTWRGDEILFNNDVVNLLPSFFPISVVNLWVLDEEFLIE